MMWSWFLAMPPDGTTAMQATEWYALFERAESMGRNVRDLLQGGNQALTNMEWQLWLTWRRAQARIAQQGRKAKQ